ncbi:MAG TPA: hypothetical protein PL182_12350, partial [Pseudobdellovibrionaceae bacterium]|nr:hypothetical protein [Pseudobdellovibrionaceae bacterium]
YQDTGIRGDQVALFQNIFIDGSNRWAVELWKLMAADGTVRGWLAAAYGERMGCRSHAEGAL